MENEGPRKPLVLHVEDDDGSAFLLSLVLRDQGVDADVVRVCDGEEALRFIAGRYSVSEDRRPSVVVLDLNLPKKSGHEVLCDIREATAGWDLPVIIFTASNRPVDREKALSFGANRYIQKSLNLDGFIAVSQQVLEYVSSRPSAGPGKQS